MAHLLIIDLPGGNDTDIIHAATEAGHGFSFLTSDLALYMRQPAVAAALAGATEALAVPGFDFAAVEAQVLALHQRHAIDAVLCLIDIRLTEAARLAQRLRLRYLNPCSAALLRDKYEVRRRLAERGLAQPAFELALSNEDLRQAVTRLGYPVLIKPADGYGSQNIVVLNDVDDLRPWVEPQAGMLPSRADYGLGVQANDRLLVERYMRGTLIGCDTLTVNGQHRLLGVNEKQMFAPPSFAIQGGCFVPRHAGHAEIEAYAHAVLDAVGFDWGASHIELMLTAEGPRLVEVNARLVGAKIPRLLNCALKRSIHRDLIEVHLGGWPAPANGEPVAVQAAVTRWLVAPAYGELEGIDWPSWVDEKIQSVEAFKHPGDMVRPPFENADRLACVMTCAASREEAEQVAQRYIAQTTVRIRPLRP